MGRVRRPISAGLIALAALVLGACGSNSVILKRAYDVAPSGTKFVVGDVVVALEDKDPPPPEHFLIELKSFLKANLAAANASGEGDPGAWQVEVKVVAYRMRSGFTRFMFGAMAGKDGVDSYVQVVDANGSVLGESKVTTFNATAIGSSEDVAKMHADEIAKFVLGDKRNATPVQGVGGVRSESDSRYPKPRHNPGDMNDDGGKK